MATNLDSGALHCAVSAVVKHCAAKRAVARTHAKVKVEDEHVGVIVRVSLEHMIKDAVAILGHDRGRGELHIIPVADLGWDRE